LDNSHTEHLSLHRFGKENHLSEVIGV